jgi:hypothetical protein
MANIYVASSWRNKQQPLVVQTLREAGHEVYDFKNPPDASGFKWSDIDPEWEAWTNDQYTSSLEHPLAEKGFKADFDAMAWADAVVLVLPCGRSAHLELGWGVGSGKKTCVLLSPGAMDPELMVKMCDHIALDVDSVLEWLESLTRFEQFAYGSKLFGCVDDVVRTRKMLPAIVDDDYPRASYYFQGAVRRLVDFVQKEKGRK